MSILLKPIPIKGNIWGTEHFPVFFLSVFFLEMCVCLMEVDRIWFMKAAGVMMNGAIHLVYLGGRSVLFVPAHIILLRLLWVIFISVQSEFLWCPGSCKSHLGFEIFNTRKFIWLSPNGICYQAVLKYLQKCCDPPFDAFEAGRGRHTTLTLS